MKELILIGAGGHAKVVLEAALRAGLSVRGLVDKNDLPPNPILGKPVLGNDDYLADLEPSRVLLNIAVGTVRADVLRKNLFETLKNRGFEFAVIRHPDTTIASSASRL